jgi:hypothetical protein
LDTEEIVDVVIEIVEFAERGEDVPRAKAYHVLIDGERFKIDTDSPTVGALLEMVGKRSCSYELIEELAHHDNYVLEPHETVNLRKRGLKGFITAHKDWVTVFFGDGDDRKAFKIERGERTVAEIMALPKDEKTPASYDLYIEEGDEPPALLPDNLPVKVCGCEVFHVQAKTGGSS